MDTVSTISLYAALVTTGLMAGIPSEENRARPSLVSGGGLLSTAARVEDGGATVLDGESLGEAVFEGPALLRSSPADPTEHPVRLAPATRAPTRPRIITPSSVRRCRV